MENTAVQPYFSFLKGGGEMGELTRNFDWAQTPLGTPDAWPVSLRTLVGMVMTSRFPMLLLWGPELTTFYNDAFRPSLGHDGKHPSSFGKRAPENWPESWDIQGPHIRSILDGGEPVWNENQRLPITRNGKTEWIYWTYSFSPVTDDAGSIAGVLITCTETIPVKNIRKLNNAHAELEQALEKYHSLQKVHQQADNQFRTIANSAPSGLWLSDERGRLTYLNKTLADWTGLPYEQMLGGGWLDGVMEEDRENARTKFREAVATRSHYEVQFRIVKYGRKGVWCRNAGDPFYAEDGSFSGYAGYCMDIDDSMAIQQQLEKSRQQLLGLFEQSPIAIAIMSRENLVFTMVNPFYSQLLNRSQEEVIGKPLLEVFPELEGKGFDLQMYQVIETGVPYTAQEVAANVVRNGVLQPIWINLAYQPLRETDNTISGVLVVAIDITGQVHARRQIEESEVRFRQIFEQAPIATCLFAGRELVIEVANDIMIEFWKKDRSVIGKPLREALPELEGQPFLDILDNIFNTGETYAAQAAEAHFEIDGVLGTYYYDFTYKPLFDTSGQVFAIMNMAIDVTGQVLARKKQQESEQALRGAIELADLGTWSLNLATHEVTYSHRVLEWIGLDHETVSLEELKQLIPGEDRKRLMSVTAQALSPASEGKADIEYRSFNKKTGEQKIMQAQGKVIYNDKGVAVRLDGAIRDVTLERGMQLALEAEVVKRTSDLAEANSQLAEFNLQLQQTNIELNQFAYIASHDLQEPLRKVRTFTCMLEDSLGTSSPESRGMIDKIKKSTERMQNLILDVLQFSRLSRETGNYSTVDLSIILEAVLADLELLIEQKEARITYDALPVIEAIPLQMTQLFTNLLSNALKFASGGRPPRISVTCAPLPRTDTGMHPELSLERNYWKITIQDNGIGFEQEYAERIFVIFQRLHGRLQYEGTGIGLALCKKIVINHKGLIWAEAIPDEGATFTIILPEAQ